MTLVLQVNVRILEAATNYAKTHFFTVFTVYRFVF